MLESSARLLALLGLLQTRPTGRVPSWPSGSASPTGPSATTSTGSAMLGYPVDAVRGPHGRYRLGVGAKLPPLLLDDDEAVAVAVGLRAADRRSRGIEETSARALAKLEHVLPHRLQRQVSRSRDARSPGRRTPVERRGSGRRRRPCSPLIAAAIRDHEEIRFGYRGDEAAGRSSRTGW